MNKDALAMLTPEQCRMARAALRLGVRDLAQRAELSAMTVTRFENGSSAGSRETTAAIRSALEKAGVVFIDENGGGAGVRLKGGRDQHGMRPEELDASNDD